VDQYLRFELNHKLSINDSITAYPMVVKIVIFRVLNGFYC